MAENEPNNEPTEPPQAPTPPEPPADDGGKGKPDPAIAASKYREERDKARSDLAELQKQLEAIKGDSEELAKLKQSVKEQQEALEAAKQQAQIEQARTMMLHHAGCADIEVALKVWDGEDIEAFKASKPYLFKTVQKGSTGAPPAGAAGMTIEDQKKQLAKVAKLE